MLQSDPLRWCVRLSNAVDRGLEPGRVRAKTQISICCLSAKHVALWRKSKPWLAQNQGNVSEWSDMFTRGLLLQRAGIIKHNYACWSSTKPTSSCHRM